MPKQKIYIAGPMTGLPNLNMAAFFTAAESLRSAGHCVLNPAEITDGLTEPEYMDICFAMIRAATAIHLLAGWEQSEGAQAEYHYAKKLGLEVSTEITYLCSAPSYIFGMVVIGEDFAKPNKQDKSAISKAQHPDSELCGCCCGYGKFDSGDICECCDGEGIEIKEGQ